MLNLDYSSPCIKALWYNNLARAPEPQNSMIGFGIL